jgi:DNA-directed RNA polymerase subunit H (RpoH/RPB5)
MKILSIIIIGLLLSNCTNSYVKNKKAITSPNDLMKFTNIWCDKSKSTEKKIKMCGQGWSKDLNISESKAIMNAKLKIADITQHTLVSNEKITHKENSKGVVKSYEMKANNVLEEATISGYKIVSKKVMKEKNGWRTMVLLEYNLL